MAGKLFIVPTPIGNLGDMAPRCIEILKDCSLILAEDTRTSSVITRHFNITTPMISHHKFNEHAAVSPIIDRLKGGEVFALVSDAGTPAISDPGFMLVRECRRENITVETLPGPTAFVPALVNSGLPCERFSFEGFLPQKKGRATRLSELASEQRTMVFYESPIRLVKTLQELAKVMGGDRDASVSREISKIHNTTENGTLDELISFFTQNNPKGEIVIVVSGKRDDKLVRKIHKNKYRDIENDKE